MTSYERIRALMDEARYHDALMELRDALAEDGTAAEFHFLAAVCLSQLGGGDEVEFHLETAQALDERARCWLEDDPRLSDWT